MSGRGEGGGFTVARFADHEAEWDAWVGSLPESTYLHSVDWLRYQRETVGAQHDASFALVDERGHAVALCPLAFTTTSVAGAEHVQASWAGAPLAVPAIERRPAASRRRLARAVYAALNQAARSRSADEILLRSHPMTRAMIGGDERPIGPTEPLSAGYRALPENTLIVDLGRPVEALEADMTHEQRKHLRHAVAGGITVTEHRGADPSAERAHLLYAETHFRSAGRKTRPDGSFAEMLATLRRGRATLFVGAVGSLPVSFLYCGEFSETFAFGWSQVNVDEHERALPLRHLVEWRAILAYRDRGFRYYEIGERPFGPLPHRVPTHKELTIASFKERYGGALWTYFMFERWWDPTVYEAREDERRSRFLASGYFAAGAEPDTMARSRSSAPSSR